MQSFDLAAILAARICHDLVSPVGAVVNGVELMREVNGAGIADELDLVDQSATRASRLLTFYRLAFGRAQAAEGGGISRSQFRDRVQPVLQAPRLRIDWQALDGPALEPASARLIGLMGLCARASVGVSGVIGIGLDPNGDLPVSVLISGDHAALGPQHRLWLGGARTPLPDPRQIEFMLLPAAAAGLGLQLEIDSAPGRVTLTARR